MGAGVRSVGRTDKQWWQLGRMGGGGGRKLVVLWGWMVIWGKTSSTNYKFDQLFVSGCFRRSEVIAEEIFFHFSSQYIWQYPLISNLVPGIMPGDLMLLWFQLIVVVLLIISTYFNYPNLVSWCINRVFVPFMRPCDNPVCQMCTQCRATVSPPCVMHGSLYWADADFSTSGAWAIYKNSETNEEAAVKCVP